VKAVALMLTQRRRRSSTTEQTQTDQETDRQTDGRTDERGGCVRREHETTDSFRSLALATYPRRRLPTARL